MQYLPEDRKNGLRLEDTPFVGRRPKTNESFRGTAAYASLGSLVNIEQSKRDDLEGLFWVGVFLEFPDFLRRLLLQTVS